MHCSNGGKRLYIWALNTPAQIFTCVSPTMHASTTLPEASDAFDPCTQSRNKCIYIQAVDVSVGYKSTAAITPEGELLVWGRGECKHG